MTPLTPFEYWWYHEGSAGPNGLDMEEHCKRMCQIAWNNGAFKERQRIADHLDDSMCGDYSALREQVRSGVLWP